MRSEPGTAQLFVLTGVQAAGKTTVGRGLAMRFTRGVFIEGDAVREMVVRGRVEMSPEPSAEALAQLSLRYGAQALLAGQYFDAGFTVVVEDVILGRHLDEYVAGLGDRPVHLVVLAPDAATAAGRDAGRGKRAYLGNWTVAQLDDVLRHRTPRRGLWLDNSRLTVDETVDAILGRRAEAALVRAGGAQRGTVSAPLTPAPAAGGNAWAEPAE